MANCTTSFLLMTIVVLLKMICSVNCTARPMIGILAQENNGHKNGSYISASYVKAVESAGARVVPIFIGKDRGYYIRLLSELNGVVFPGGEVNLHARGGYGEAGRYIFQEAIYLNDNGKHFPLLGLCQGLELVATISNKGKDLLTKCVGVLNKAMNLNFKAGYANSSLYGNVSRADLAALAKYNLTSNHHELCLTPTNFSHFLLDKFWNILTTNYDAKNLEFISSMEAKKYPFAAVQFHPEKVAYEWNASQQNPHSPLAVRVNRIFYDWLIQQARLSNNKFNSTDIENRLVIYNFSPTFTGKYDGYSEQVYNFKW